MWWIEQSGLSVVRMQAEVRRRADWLRGRPSAQSTVEYALVGALVVIAAASALTMLGGELNTVFTNISHTLATAAGR